MNLIISQNCCAGHIYRYAHIKVNHPFVWCVIDFNSMLILINEWYTLNFSNYEIKKDQNWNFSIIIDNKVKIQYVHYKFDPAYNTPTKKNDDLRYNKIWEYIVEKYESRLARLNTIKYKIKPTFLICNGSTIYQDCVYSEEQLKILEQYDNVIIIRNLEKNAIHKNAKQLLDIGVIKF